MRRLVVFNNVSLDGYFVDANGDMLFCQRECQWHRRASVWQSHLRPYGKLLADTAGHEELSCGGRRDEQSSKGGVLENTGQGVVEEHQAGEGRLGGGSSEDEERIGAGYGDPGKREHCFAIGAGRIDRRIPGGAESHPAWKRQNHV